MIHAIQDFVFLCYNHLIDIVSFSTIMVSFGLWAMAGVFMGEE
jgi:hypothetical protein